MKPLIHVKVIPQSLLSNISNVARLVCQQLCLSTSFKLSQPRRVVVNARVIKFVHEPDVRISSGQLSPSMIGFQRPV